MSTDRHPDVERWIDRHFAGRLEREHERAMRVHLAEGCPSCRHHYESHLLMGMIDPAALPAEERLARALDVRPARRRWLLPVAVGTAVAAAAVVLMLRAPTQDTGERTTLASRGAPGAAVTLTTYSLSAGKAPEIVDGRVARTGELAFAYSNAAGKRYLMVLGIDEHRHVYWYHPAWTEAGTNPVAVAAAAGPGPHELPEAISHRLDGRRLTLFALFMDAALDVQTVEAVANRWSGTGPLPFEESAGVVQTQERLQVWP